MRLGQEMCLSLVKVQPWICSDVNSYFKMVKNINKIFIIWALYGGHYSLVSKHLRVPNFIQKDGSLESYDVTKGNSFKN